MKIRRLAILAGKGLLPLIAARNAIDMGIDIKVYTLSEASDLSLPAEIETIKVSITQFGKILKQLKKDKISHIVMLGKVSKEMLFKNLRFDFKTISLLALMINRNDDNIFKTMQKEFAKINVEVVAQTYFLQSLLLPAKVYTKKKPNKNDWQDINYGFYYAKKLGEIDVGQTVIVKNQTVLALEAIEGTDECIKRGGKLSHGKGAVVCKAEKTYQDQRWDIPTVGIDTLMTMKNSGCHLLAVEAMKTFVVEPEKFIAEANRLGIIFVAYKM